MNCLANFRQRVNAEDWLAPDQLDAVETEVRSLIDRAVSEARAAPAPALDDLCTDVYVSY